MDRLLSVVVFLVLQAGGVAVAAPCYGPACEWVTGGCWLSPVVRIPLVVLGVVLAEGFLLAAVWPCNRLTHRLWGPHCRGASGTPIA